VKAAQRGRNPGERRIVLRKGKTKRKKNSVKKDLVMENGPPTT